MSWLSLLQLVLGFITGLLGTATTEYFNYKNKKLDKEIRQMEMQHELVLSDRETARVTKLAEMEVEKELQVSADELQAMSYKNDVAIKIEGMKLSTGQKWMVVFAEVLNRLVRPVSTAWYQVLSLVLWCWFAWMLHEYHDQLLSDTEFFRSSFVMLVDTTLYLATTCTTWFFGVRGVGSGRRAVK